LTNSGGRPGDLLFLTKAVGGGLVTTGAKRGLAPEEAIAAGIATMTELNEAASRWAVENGASAMTDVTGFGLVGHLHELCRASGVAARLEASAVPAIDGALELAADERCIAGGSRRNTAHAGRFVTWSSSVPAERRVLLTDAMTSGGLLIALPPGRSASAPGTPIGSLVEGSPGEIEVR
jgi:selenide,water dikinase